MRTVASKVMLGACLQRSDKVRYDDVEIGNELNSMTSGPEDFGK